MPAYYPYLWTKCWPRKSGDKHKQRRPKAYEFFCRVMPHVAHNIELPYVRVSAYARFSRAHSNTLPRSLSLSVSALINPSAFRETSFVIVARLFVPAQWTAFLGVGEMRLGKMFENGSQVRSTQCHLPHPCDPFLCHPLMRCQTLAVCFRFVCFCFSALADEIAQFIYGRSS